MTEAYPLNLKTRQLGPGLEIEVSYKELCGPKGHQPGGFFMKAVNIKSWVKSPRVQKWGLFALLAVTLGFNLSMNPEHFNNIARIEKPEAFQSIEMASGTSDHAGLEKEIAKQNKMSEEGRAALAKEAAEKGAKTSASAVVTTSSSKESDKPDASIPNEITFPCKKRDSGTDLCKAKISQSKSSIGEVIIEAKIAGGDCAKCHDQNITVTSSKTLSVIELGAALAKEAIAPEFSISSDKKDKKEKLTVSAIDEEELTKTKNLNIIAQACKTKTKDSRLSCHSKNLIDLTKKLGDSSEALKALNYYFDHFISPPLNNLYRSPVLNTMYMQSDYTKVNEAEEIALELVEEMNPDNCAEILSKLEKLKTSGITSRAKQAKELLLDSQYEKRSSDPATMFHGAALERLALDALNPGRLRAELNLDMNQWSTAMMGDKEFALPMLRLNLQNPVSRFIGHVEDLSLNRGAIGAGQLTLAQRLAGLTIPEYAGSNYPTLSNLRTRGFTNTNPLARLWGVLDDGYSTPLGATSRCSYSPLDPGRYTSSGQCLDSVDPVSVYRSRQLGLVNPISPVSRSRGVGRVGRVRQ